MRPLHTNALLVIVPFRITLQQLMAHGPVTCNSVLSSEAASTCWCSDQSWPQIWLGAGAADHAHHSKGPGHYYCSADAGVPLSCLCHRSHPTAACSTWSKVATDAGSTCLIFACSGSSQQIITNTCVGPLLNVSCCINMSGNDCAQNDK